MDTIPVDRANVFRDDENTIHQPVLVNLPEQTGIYKILIIKWSSMGDVVISTAIMQDIYEAFPHAELHLNAMPPWHHLFANDARFSSVWTVDLRKTERGWRGIKRWLGKVKQEHYDLIIDLQTNDRTRFLLTLLRLSGCAPKYLLGNYPVFPYTIRQQSVEQTHVISLMRRSLAAIGVPSNTKTPVLYSSPADIEQAKMILVKYKLDKESFVVLLPGSHAAGQTKRWGASHYAGLAVELNKRGVQRIVLIGGVDEAGECEQIAAYHPEFIINLCGQTTLLALPEIYRHAEMIIGNDTGTAHLAAAAQRPVLVICGPTDPRRVKPLGPQVIAIQAEIACKNCYQKTCSHHSCMENLTVDHVLMNLEFNLAKVSKS
ncbi:MAG: glycosyltransferase family 9 protein [Methylococcaceae bacterium]|nr:glycosyltransferase family 9 protein [Methylococcaceae bacterium]